MYLPSILSWKAVSFPRVYPAYDLLRDHLRFQAMLERYDPTATVQASE